MDSPRIIISGGGTGGHIYPAIAIANAIKEITPKAEILFVGAKGRMEMEKVPEAGYAIEGLDIAGLQRKLTLKNLSFPFKVLKSLAQASAIVKNFKPNAVVGVGGYASGPLVFSAARRGVPAVLQEQNSYAGLTNKILSKYVQKICVAYPHMQQYFPASKIQFTGNPVRQDISKLENKRTEALTHFSFSPDKPVLLILGGSLGARTLNESLLADWRKLEDNGVQVIWQCGKFYYEDLKAKLTDQLSASIKLVPFIKEMPLAYAAANVVISRAGALSISELCLAAKPAILVPSPNVAEDHQTKNAMALVKADAAILIKDSEAGAKLIDRVIDLIEDKQGQKKLSENIMKLGKPQAAQEIAHQILALAT